MAAERNSTAVAWGVALLSLAAIVVLGLPVMLKDGPVAEGIWLAAIAAGLIVAAVGWAADAPARRAKAQAAAVARQQAQIEAARIAAERAAWLAPKQVGSAWHHGACTTNHRTYDTAVRCRRG